MEVYLVAVVAVGCVVVALWLLAGRIRTWKEQILHSVSIVESNNAIAHEATRRELALQMAALEQRNLSALEATGAHLDQMRAELQHSLQSELAAVRTELAAARNAAAGSQAELALVRGDVKELLEQTSIRRLAQTYGSAPRMIGDSHPPRVRFEQAAAFIRSLDPEGDDPEASRRYLDVHLPRLARTLDITPPPDGTRRALELGAYMQITPALACVLGYAEVRGGYLGTPDHGPLRKTASVDGKEIFSCQIDYFDAERDSFPYQDGFFDVVLCCEIIEHFRFDPMHMLLEAGRVLASNGALVLTTPNVASYSSVARAISGVNPQIWSHYPVHNSEVPHVREYTPAEIHDLMIAAGFAVEWLFTEPIDSHNAEAWLAPLFDHLGYPRNLRGEQIYLVARKRTGAKIERRPEFLYE